MAGRTVSPKFTVGSQRQEQEISQELPTSIQLVLSASISAKTLNILNENKNITPLTFYPLTIYPQLSKLIFLLELLGANRLYFAKDFEIFSEIKFHFFLINTISYYFLKFCFSK